MPYIDKSRRPEVEPNVMDGAKDPGELNYQLTELVLDFLGDRPNYEKFNAAVGALECAKLELYRRKIAPYENIKKESNGDVY